MQTNQSSRSGGEPLTFSATPPNNPAPTPEVPPRNSTKRRRSKVFAITCTADLLSEGEGDLLAAMKDREKEGIVSAGLAELARAVRRKRRQLPPEPHTARQLRGATIKRSVQRERDALLSKGIIEIATDIQPSFGGRVTGYRLRSDVEIWSFLRSAGLTHWRRAGRGRKLLAYADVQK